MLSTLTRKLKTFYTATPEHRRARLRQLANAWLYEAPVTHFYIGLFSVVAVVGWIISPLVKLRIFDFHGSRIGEFSVRLEELHRRRIFEKKRWPLFGVEIYVADGVANQQLLTMYRRKVLILVSKLANRAVARFSAAFPGNRVVNAAPLWPMQFHLFKNPYSTIALTKSELEQGRKLIEKMGIPAGASYIGFQARDSAFLKTQDPARDFSYHDYRDSRIANYIEATERLADLGIWSLRMGSVVSEPIPSKNPRIIDYANKHRSVFGDVFICATCKFFLGTGSGLSEVPGVAFGKPVIFVNSAPIGFMLYRSVDLLIPKKYWSTELKRFLSVREIVQLKADRIYDSAEFKRLGIELIENTSEEIRDVALEMNARIDGTWVPHAEDEELQNRYRAAWPKDHLLTGYPSRVGAAFLRQNRFLLD